MKMFKKFYYSMLPVLVLVCLQLPAYTQNPTKLPDTPAGKIVGAYFDAFNSDDDVAYRVFITTKRMPSFLEKKSIDERLKSFHQLKKMIPRLELRRIVKNDMETLMVLAYSEPSDSWFKIEFAFSDEKPTLLKKFSLRPGRAPKSDSDEGLGEWKDLNGLLKNVIEKNGIPGISMVTIVNGRIDEIAVAGVRKIGTSDLIEKDDRFHIGSVTKSMTATIIGKLIDNKQLTSATTLRTIFPELAMQPSYESVTIEQLLRHTAGIPGYLTTTDEEEEELLSLPGSPAEQRLAFVKLVLQQKPISEPGASWSYSNAGYSILGTISERLTNKSWEALLQEYIFSPLKMETAGTGWPNNSNAGNEPIGHFGSLKKLRPQEQGEYILGPYIDPAGDIHCSMKDLAQFAIAHLNGVNNQGSILNPTTFQWLHAPPKNGEYAAGWFIQKTDSGTVVHEHPGSAGTYFAYMAIEPATNRGWVISANSGDFKLYGIFREIIEVYQSK